MNQWTAGPMKLPANGWHPIPRRANIIGLQKHPHSVRVRRGERYDLRADAGLAAYRYLNPNGTLSLQVPDLFDVLKQTLDGRREAYSNVEIGEQAEELFRPPNGVNVVTTTRPGGIIAEPIENSAAHREHIRGQR